MQRKHLNPTGMLTALAVLAILMGATCALAQGPGHGKGMMNRMGPGHGPGMGQGGMPPQMAEQLNLTEDQQTAIEAIGEQTRKDNLELRKQMMRLRNELQGEMLKDDPAQSAVLDLTEKIGALRTRMQTTRVKARLAVRKQLTPEQRDMMLMMKSERKMGRRGHGGFAGRDRPGGFGPGQHPDCDGSGPGKGLGRGNWDDD